MEELLGHFSQEACPDLTHQSCSHSPCPITGRPQWVSFADPKSQADGRAPCLGDKWAGASGQQTGLCQRVSAHLPFTLWAPLLVSRGLCPRTGRPSSSYPGFSGSRAAIPLRPTSRSSVPCDWAFPGVDGAASYFPGPRPRWLVPLSALGDGHTVGGRGRAGVQLDGSSWVIFSASLR